MNAQQCPLKEFIQGEKIFQLPVYQRNYAWHERHVTRFLDDIENLMVERKNHFLGVIVYVADRIPSTPAQRLIIDGQQRLTTAMIFLLALANSNETLAMKISRGYLQNEFITGSNNVKLHLIEQDQINFLALMKNPDNCDHASKIWISYLLCKRRIAQWNKLGQTAQDILDAFEKIQIVYLQLLADEDDPQLIFESINSTGLELSTADLIRNFLLMDVRDPAEQQRLFKTYWIPIAEKNLHRDNARLNEFFLHYVVFKKESADITKERLYETFKDIFRKENREKIFLEIERFSGYFEAFAFETEKYSAPVQKSLNDIAKLKQTTCYPFLFHLFDDFANEIIDEKTLEDVLHLIVSYYVQVIVCGMAASSRRELFVKLYSRTFAVESNKEKYYESIKKFLTTQNTMRETLPSQEEFFNSLVELKILNNKTLCRFILEDLAGIDSERLKIVPIMPEILTKTWNDALPKSKKISAEDHERLRYTLGNLTLAERDAPIASFEEKKSILSYSPARELNRDVIDKKEWTAHEIEERTWVLARKIVDRYKVEQGSDPRIVFDTQMELIPDVTLETWNESINGILLGYTLENESHEIKKWREMFEEILKTLDQKSPNVLQDLIDKDDTFRVSRRNFLGSSRIREGIYVRTDLDVETIIEILKALLPMYELQIESLKFIMARD